MIGLLNMLATFNVGKGKDDIQEGILLPEDWYTAEISKEPYEDKNGAWKEVGEGLSLADAFKLNERCGSNILLNLRVKTDDPETDGRSLTKWLPLPNEFDEGRFMNDGQPRADWKAGIIHKWVEAFGGNQDGAEVSFAEGQKALIYVVEEVDRLDNSKRVNAISMNVDPRAIGSSGLVEDNGQDPLDGGIGLLP